MMGEIITTRNEPAVEWANGQVALVWADATGGIAHELIIGNVVQIYHGGARRDGWNAEYDLNAGHDKRVNLGDYPTAIRAVMALASYWLDRHDAITSEQEAKLDAFINGGTD